MPSSVYELEVLLGKSEQGGGWRVEGGVDGFCYCRSVGTK